MGATTIIKTLHIVSSAPSARRTSDTANLAALANTSLKQAGVPVVGRQDGLPALKATDAHSNVRGLDHADVIRAIANRQRRRLARQRSGTIHWPASEVCASIAQWETRETPQSFNSSAQSC
jgi:hypothetical protein